MKPQTILVYFNFRLLRGSYAGLTLSIYLFSRLNNPKNGCSNILQDDLCRCISTIGLQEFLVISWGEYCSKLAASCAECLWPEDVFLLNYLFSGKPSDSALNALSNIDAQVVSLDPNVLERLRRVENEPIPGFSCFDHLYNDPVNNSQTKSFTFGENRIEMKPPVEIRLGIVGSLEMVVDDKLLTRHDQIVEDVLTRQSANSCHTSTSW